MAARNDSPLPACGERMGEGAGRQAGGANAAIRNVRRVQRGGGRSPATVRASREALSRPLPPGGRGVKQGGSHAHPMPGQPQPVALPLRLGGARSHRRHDMVRDRASEPSQPAHRRQRLRRTPNRGRQRGSHCRGLRAGPALGVAGIVGEAGTHLERPAYVGVHRHVGHGGRTGDDGLGRAVHPEPPPGIGDPGKPVGVGDGACPGRQRLSNPCRAVDRRCAGRRNVGRKGRRRHRLVIIGIDRRRRLMVIGIDWRRRLVVIGIARRFVISVG